MLNIVDFQYLLSVVFRLRKDCFVAHPSGDCVIMKQKLAFLAGGMYGFEKTFWNWKPRFSKNFFLAEEIHQNLPNFIPKLYKKENFNFSQTSSFKGQHNRVYKKERKRIFSSRKKEICFFAKLIFAAEQNLELYIKSISK